MTRETTGGVPGLGGVTLIRQVDGRPHLAHRLDGRYGPMDPKELVAVVRELAAAIDITGVDYVVGFPEGGAHPAFAFALIVDRPLILSTRLRMDLTAAVSFQEPHSRLGTTHYLHGLRAGNRVVIIEDEVTTGRTALNAVRALRAAGIQVTDVGAILAVDSPVMWQLMVDEGVSLHVGFRVPPEYAEGMLGLDAP